MSNEKGNELQTVMASLPNGLHDAALYEVRVDMMQQRCSLIVGADISSVANGGGLPRLRRGCLSVSGITFLEIEPLRMRQLSQAGGYVSIDAGVGEKRRPKGLHRVEVPTGSWELWVFLRESNSFIQVVANGVEFEWSE